MSQPPLSMCTTVLCRRTVSALVQVMPLAPQDRSWAETVKRPLAPHQQILAGPGEGEGQPIERHIVGGLEPSIAPLARAAPLPTLAHPVGNGERGGRFTKTGTWNCIQGRQPVQIPSNSRQTLSLERC